MAGEPTGEDAYEQQDKVNHCGRTGCECLHLFCDRGFEYIFDRTVPKADGSDGVASYERVKPCSGCKPEAYDAMLRSRSRPDWFRRLRSLRPDAP